MFKEFRVKGFNIKLWDAAPHWGQQVSLKKDDTPVNNNTFYEVKEYAYHIPGDLSQALEFDYTAGNMPNSVSTCFFLAGDSNDYIMYNMISLYIVNFEKC